MSRTIVNPTLQEIPTTADVVIIGGGPAGAGAAWALQRAQPGLHTVLIERNAQLGAGASMASLENYRTTWEAECLAVMMRRSYDVFHNAAAEIGEHAHLGLKEQGYLWVGVTEADAARLRGDVERLHAVGLTHILYLQGEALRARFPWLSPRVLAGKFDPKAGWMDSNGLIHGLARAAAGCDVLLGMGDVRIVREGDRVIGVEVGGARIAAGHVLLAAGAEARPIGRTAGVDLPVVVRPRQSFTTRWRAPQYPADAPMLIAAAPFPHVRPEARDGAIFGWEYRWSARHLGGDPAADHLETPVWPADQAKDPRFPSLTLAVFARQLGEESGFADGRWLRGLDHRAGYYVYRDGTAAYTTLADGTRQPYTSQRAIIDRVPGIDGFSVSIAHVGHGIMSAPAAGEIAAAHVLGLPLPHPAYADFGFAAAFALHDSGGLSPASKAVYAQPPHA
jgi:glycine/D-amino acid oxidase-like deaminating enzyme